MAAVEVLEGPSLVGIGRSAEVLGALAQHRVPVLLTLNLALTT